MVTPHSNKGGKARKFVPAALVVVLHFFAFCAVAAPLPQPLPNWRIELVAEAPRVKHPSVAAAAPDGRVFVAEDPMDISTPQANATEGRILCLHPDGSITVFAEKLHAVFGLQYLEGKIYALHNPQFSMWDDDHGVGKNRRELIAQTLPEPWALNWNDHVPANFKLGMDGFFYVASGDKGLYGAQGTDGAKATLSTGGIFRIRPDGTGLEVMSNGVRNILDVALNSEDEEFTYDNTDEHNWMGRFTHMVEAGFYGYPHDFNPRQPHTLWMIDDYGAGAACGVFANTGDGLPPEFRDNLFLSDFGKRQIMRVTVARDGGSYRAVSKEDLFPNPPGDFRPVGITPSSDGRSIYICDWQYRDEKANISVGRLLKLSWNGPHQPTPQPAWWLPAATAREFSATTDELIAALAHPARDVRLTAQRRLADRGAAKELLATLHNSAAPAPARVHALWALDAMEQANSARAEITAATRDPNPFLRRQALRQLGLRRAATAQPAIVERLRDDDPSVRFQAATALGRLGDPTSAPALVSRLDDSDLFARFAIFTALNRIGASHSSAWPVITTALENGSERVRERAMLALRETYDPALLNALAAMFRDSSKPLPARRAALQLIAAQHHRLPAWDGKWWAYHPALQPAPVKTTPWSGTPAVLTLLRETLRDPDATFRRTAIEALVAARDLESAPMLRDSFNTETDPATRATILRALGAMKAPGVMALATAELKSRTNLDTVLAAMDAVRDLGGSDAIQALTGFLNQPGADPAALALAVQTLGRLDAKDSLPGLTPLLTHTSASVRAATLEALGRLQRETVLPALKAALDDPSPDVRHAVVNALAALKTASAVPLLLQAHADPFLATDAFFALTRTSDPRALPILLQGLGSKNPAERDAAHLAIRNLKDLVLPAIESQAQSLSSQTLTGLRQIYAGNAKAEGGPLFAQEIIEHKPEDYLNAAISQPGNPAHGRALFAEPRGLNCLACHRVGGEGGDTGPDLSGVGAQFDRRALAEAIIYPSKTVREGYQQIAIQLADGDEISGVVKGETTDTLILRDSAAREHRIPRASIKSRQNSALSLMPEGLQSALSLEDFTDLVSYLATLKK